MKLGVELLPTDIISERRFLSSGKGAVELLLKPESHISPARLSQACPHRDARRPKKQRQQRVSLGPAMSLASPALRSCASEAEQTDANLSCARCRTDYCSLECQTADWAYIRDGLHLKDNVNNVNNVDKVNDNVVM